MVRCGSCGAQVPEEALLCQHCGAFVDRFTAPAQRHDPPSQQGAGAAGPVTPQPDATRTEAPVDVEGFGWADPPPGEAADVAGLAAIVHLPDGSRVLLEPGTEVELGRWSNHPVVSAALATLDTVSRHQALVAWEGGVLRVTHLGRTNPTYVEGAVVTGPVSVGLPVEIRFGTAVSITVTRGD